MKRENKTGLLNRLKRIEGQVRGVAGMGEDESEGAEARQAS